MIWWLKTRTGRLLTGISAFLGMLGLSYLKGRSAANSERLASDAKEYRDERQQIDEEISGIGGTDVDRVAKLRDIARGRGQGSD
jgi:hypothetical protein